MSETFADSVRRRRQERGMTQQGLADAAGLSRSTIRNVEAGDLTPHASTAERIGEAFGRAAITAKAAEATLPDGPALIFVATDGTPHAVDAEDWSATSLCPRDRVMLRALLVLVEARLDLAAPDRTPPSTPVHSLVDGPVSAVHRTDQEESK